MSGGVPDTRHDGIGLARHHDDVREPHDRKGGERLEKRRQRSAEAIFGQLSFVARDRADHTALHSRYFATAAVTGVVLEIVDKLSGPFHAGLARSPRSETECPPKHKPCELEISELLEAVSQRDAAMSLTPNLAGRGDAKQHSTGAQHAGYFGQRAVKIVNMLEHLVRAHRIEMRVGEGQATVLDRGAGVRPRAFAGGNIGTDYIKPTHPAKVDQFATAATEVEDAPALTSLTRERLDDEPIVWRVGHGWRLSHFRTSGIPLLSRQAAPMTDNAAQIRMPDRGLVRQ